MSRKTKAARAERRRHINRHRAWRERSQRTPSAYSVGLGHHDEASTYGVLGLGEQRTGLVRTLGARGGAERGAVVPRRRLTQSANNIIHGLVMAR